MDIIASYGFGVEISSMKDADNPFVKNAIKLFSNEKVDNPMVLLMVSFPKLMHYMDLFPPEASDFFVKIVREIVEARKQNPDTGTRNDFLDIILQALKELEENEGYQRMGITQKVLEAQLMVFFLAGFDTGRTTMSFTSYYFALHPEIQSKVREEILDAIKATDGEIRHDTLSKLPLLDACIAESLRLHPPLSRLERVTKRDFQ
ncbi:unnamed protein product [Darwinula stevensoni]|uniref:Cytochrome P450 n=1 Tax=Darwinula stevensoni TaxID=69355 RepID=A0A7R9AIE5_9CRUS|nr:unnamed protein product [Darwinula stevensoni]CAG0906829.1 unnamed protein product [Darwinula stevensoni]